MITLLLDTSYKELNIGLLRDEKWLVKISMEAFKKQSELTMPMIQQIFQEEKIAPSELNQIVITEGPGSYTGIRISMTIAKVLGAIGKVEVYTLNTLATLAEVSEKKMLTIMDARSKRAYVAAYQKGIELLSPQVMTLEKIKALDLSSYVIVGDRHLLGLEDQPIDILENMRMLKPQWQKQDDVHSLVPLYLKDTQEYGH